MIKNRFTYKALTLATLASLAIGAFVLQSPQKPLLADATAAATQPPTATQTPLPSVEGTLTIWVDSNRAPAVTNVGKAFTAKYNIPVRVQVLEFGNIRDQFVVAGPAGNGPDLLVGANDWIGQLNQNGLLSTIDLGNKVKSFDPIGVQAFTYGGNLLGMPTAIEAVALYYNKDLVPTPPKTWAEMKDIATKLQKDGKVELGLAMMEGDPYHHYPIFSGLGGYVFGKNKDGSYNPKDLGLDNDGSIAAAKELDSMVKAGLQKPGVDYNGMVALFKSGKAAFMITGPWQLTDIRSSKVNFGVAKLPAMTDKGPSRPFVGSQGFMVNKLSKNELLAKTFLTDYVASDDAMQALFNADPRGPAWIPVRDKLTDKEIATFALSAADGEVQPAIPEMNSVWDSFDKAIRLIYEQKADPAQAMKDAADAIRAKIAAK